MKRDQWIGLFVAVSSIVAAVVLSRILYYEEAGLRLEMYVIPALCFIIGLLMIFTDFESVVNLQDTIDELPEALSDDVESIKRGQITFPIIISVIALLGMIVETVMVFHFRKWNAEWFGKVNVLFLAVMAIIVTAILCFRSEWFQDRYERLSKKIFLIPAVGFAICAALGGYYAEPQNFGELSAMQQDALARSEQYAQSSRGSQIFYIFGRSSDSNGSNIDFHCDKDECLGILLVIIVIVCIIGSALIPHFWLLATSILLTIMVMIAIRELLYYEKHSSTEPFARW